MKKHNEETDEDRKKKGLPSLVPRPRSVYSLYPEERGKSRHDRKIASDNDDGYEVTGLMCDSDDDDADVNAIEVESRLDCFRSTGSLDMLESGVFQFNR